MVTMFYLIKEGSFWSARSIPSNSRGRGSNRKNRPRPFALSRVGLRFSGSLKRRDPNLFLDINSFTFVLLAGHLAVIACIVHFNSGMLLMGDHWVYYSGGLSG